MKLLKNFDFQSPPILYVIMTFDHGFYDFHKESISDLQNEVNFFDYEIFMPPPPPQINIDMSLYIHQDFPSSLVNSNYPIYRLTIRRDKSTYV